MATQAEITHLLRRTEYIARPARVLELTALLTLDAMVDDILAVPGPVALPPQIDHTEPLNRYDQYVFATKWWFDRMAFDSPRPIQEKMTFFWHGHFVSEWGKVEDTRAMMLQNKLFRDSAFGNFANLAQAMAIQPAMLRYLDNAHNTKSSPNQNFARELMELFLLGVGNYTEADVEASARAWTGYTVDANLDFFFNANNHDNTLKTFFTRVNLPLNGPDIITEILSSKKQIAARYIVGKLWSYFATPVGPQPAALETIATTFATTWDIRAAVRSILLHPEFYSTATMQGLVRTPVDWVVAAMALTGYRADLLNPQWYVEGMGQVPFEPPNVSGWRPNGAWINTSAMGSRAGFARHITYRLRDGTLPQNLGYDWQDLSTMSIPAAIIAVSTKFALNPLSAPTLGAMTSYLTAERAAPNRNNWWMATNLLTMALIAPEMHLA